MKLADTTLIPQNIPVYGTSKLCIFDGEQKVIAVNSKSVKLGTPIYSVGLLSDTHTHPYDGYDSVVDLARAIRWLSTRVEITCVCGDLCNANDDGGLEKHKAIVDANKGNMEMLEMAGNHENYSAYLDKVSPTTDSQMFEITGHPRLYSVERHGDVFIMCGAVRWGPMFDSESFQWLQDTLEANRNKRCFLFFHPPLEGREYCGDALDVLTWDGIAGYRDSFIALLKHYKNVIYFHGHTHCMLEMQDYLQSLHKPLPANYDYTNGIHSVHIPSLAISRDISSGTRVDVQATSEGYIMDVYDSFIVLKGIDFTKVETLESELIPIAQYKLLTPKFDIEASNL